MTQEEKDLLLRDLSCRLPYNVKVKTFVKESYTLKGLSDTEYGGVMGHLLGKFVPDNVSPKTVNYPLDQFKPYLFPMSSMTVEQICKVKNLLPDNCDISFKNQKIAFYDEGGNVKLDQLEKVFHLFNMWHIDYRGLIPLGLALDATGLKIYS